MANFKHISIDETSYDAVPAGSYVTGVKGNNETTYRTGNVNITKANVGLSNVPNVTTNNQTPTFTQASTRANIASGETLTTIFGKIMKWFADLKTVAFTGSYTDLSNLPTLVTGVKGNSETTYRTGNVNITKANVGLSNVPNVTTDNQTPTFTQASTRANIASGETLTTIFGKIMKWFADLKTVAFTGSYTDLSNLPTLVTGVKGNSETTYRTGNVNITKANIGLGNVGNFKAVSTAANQGLSATEITNARKNLQINWDGQYVNLSNSHLNTSFRAAVDKIGPYVLVYVTLNSDADLAANTVLFTLPSGYRPSGDGTNMGIMGASDVSPIQLVANANGNVLLQNVSAPLKANKYYTGLISFADGNVL